MPLFRSRSAFLVWAAFLIPASLIAASAPSTWVSLGPDGVGAILSIAVDPTSSATIYVGTKGAGVFKSTDGSATFAAASYGMTNFSVIAVAIDPAATRVLFAATEGGLFRSGDGAASWSAAPGVPATVFNGVAFDPVNPGTAYAVATDAGVCKRVDSGATRTAINAGH